MTSPLTRMLAKPKPRRAAMMAKLPKLGDTAPAWGNATGRRKSVQGSPPLRRQKARKL